MSLFSHSYSRAFSLVELVIVIVIIGIISAIAVVRLSSAADGATERQVLANVVILQKALDLYVAESGRHIGANEGDEHMFASELNAPLDPLTSGDELPDGSKVGPYLRAVPPNLMIGPMANEWVSLRMDYPTSDPGWGVDTSLGYVRVGYVHPGPDTCATPNNVCLP